MDKVPVSGDESIVLGDLAPVLMANVVFPNVLESLDVGPRRTSVHSVVPNRLGARNSDGQHASCKETEGTKFKICHFFTNRSDLMPNLEVPTVIC